MNLVLVGVNGQVIACSRPSGCPKVVEANVSSSSCLKMGSATTAGDQYAIDEIIYDPLSGDRRIAVFETDVRKDGKVDGKVISVLGVSSIGKHSHRSSFNVKL